MGRADYWAAGDHNAVCYECGRKRKASELKKHWQGYYVCPEHWEPRHPQDYVRNVQERQVPPWVQPPPADSFRAVCTFNGATCIVEWAVVDCCIVDYISPMFDSTFQPPPCTPIFVQTDTTVRGPITDWACMTLTVDAELTLDGVIGIA